MLRFAIAFVVTLVVGLGFGLGSTPTARAASPVEPGNEVEVQMARKVQERAESPILGQNLSIVVIDEASNRVIINQRGQAPLLPASNIKIITAMATLAALGPSHRFTTRVLEGRTPNEIVLQAGGDPLLNRANLRWLARKAARSLSRGRPVTLRVDESIFSGPGRGPGWPDHYLGSVAGPVQALALRGDRTRSRQERAIEVFTTALRRAGFTVRHHGSGSAPADARVLAQIAPHSVRQAVAVMLNESENDVAEVLFRHTAIARGQPPTWDGGSRAATSLLVELGIDVSSVKVMDGSGLSRANRVTTMALAQLARLSRIDPRFASMYDPAAMPIAGRSGTLDDRYGRYTRGPSRCARGKIRAKTGTLFDTIGLTGVTTALDGTEKSFAILVNNRPRRFSQLTTRRAVDGLAATITGCW